jgi:hypothetical protein
VDELAKAPAIEEKRNPEATTTVEGPTCQHHWLIETPRGSTSHGRCKVCGEEREFRNSASDHLWEDESGSGYNAWRGIRSVTRNVSDDDAAMSGRSSGDSIAAV